MPPQPITLQEWQQSALPVLRQDCISCHSSAQTPDGFLVGSDDLAIHDRVMTFQPPVVNLDAASSSQIITKGLHEGPQLTADETSKVRNWLLAELQAISYDPSHPPVVRLTTKPVAVQLCTGGDPDNASGTCPTNHLSLASVPTDGTTLPGAEIAFTAQAVSSGLYLTNMVASGGTAGLYLEHLLLVSVPAFGDPVPDPLDRYYALKFNVGPGQTSPIGGGAEDFVGFAPTNKIELHITVLTAFQPGTTGSQPDGCKVLASFKTNAQPQLSANCASCHAGASATAQAAMDMGNIAATTDDKLLLACNQVRSRINFQAPDQSGLYLAAGPTNLTNHPFQFSVGQTYTAFKTAMDIWVNVEQTTPQPAATPHGSP